ncbi:MAG: SPOR domain-containing protein, partial [Caulobacterales bacterium]|nr:SPOR domain-containing protein [Caulobacterales bacterium]
PAAPEEPPIYRVQLASFRSAAVANEAVGGFVSLYPGLVTGRNLYVEPADLGDRGMHYRVRVAGFTDKGEADSYCGTWRLNGQECIVVPR